MVVTDEYKGEKRGGSKKSQIEPYIIVDVPFTYNRKKGFAEGCFIKWESFKQHKDLYYFLHISHWI